MSRPTLASTYQTHPSLSRASLDDPFATPSIQPTGLPAIPRPVAQRSSVYGEKQQYYHHTDRPSNGRTHDDQAAVSQKTASMSSEGGSSAMTQISSIDLEKSRHARQSAAKKAHGTGGDPEKGYASPAQGTPKQSRRQSAARIAYVEEDEEFDESTELQEQKALKILLFLSGPCVVLSFLNAIWTLISLVLTTLTQPVRLCARRPSFGQQLSGLAGPALNLQLKSIYTPLPPHADEDTSYRAGTLVMVQLLTPFASLGMMVAAWVAAVFWLASAVVGDPAGMDKRDDGKETILTLRDWWEKWLVRCIRED
ncbi:hypothetical protein TI39_contig340g00033 [Zymoseptoria brevis]|uniref:Uncharacterized protein n=1 Tax=Zymoseptoria brevis TaxID=1047168 RepID=A0A0F4GT06_9PEZI|nr:hypothetical protein TI39_contig340g00033 [Zymoseptoria brevis]